MKAAKLLCEKEMLGNRYSLVRYWHTLADSNGVQASVWLDQRNTTLYHCHVHPGGRWYIFREMRAGNSK